jgi:sulfur-carrier protein
MRVRVFAALRELAGASTVEVEASTVGELLDRLSARLGPQFDRIMAAGRVVIDGEPADRDRSIAPGAEVALLPPVSGGVASGEGGPSG